MRNAAWPLDYGILRAAMPYRVHRTILIFLLTMLPIQGAMAASRWICVAPQTAGPATSVDHVQLSTGHQHHLNSVPDDSADLEVAHDIDSPTPHDFNGTCHLCAACCLTSAAPPPPLVFSSLAPAHAGFLPVSVSVPHNVADGPERPPRTI